MRGLAVCAALILFVFAVIAVNQEQISLRFLAWQTPALSVFWWLLLALMLGLALGFAASLGVITRQAMRVRRMRRDLATAGETSHDPDPSASADAP